MTTRRPNIYISALFALALALVLSGLRAAQLMRGCTPRVVSAHKVITTAQMEVAEWKVVRAPLVPVVPQPKPALTEKEAVGLLT